MHSRAESRVASGLQNQPVAEGEYQSLKLQLSLGLSVVFRTSGESTDNDWEINIR